MLQSSHQSNGSRRYATPPQQISAFNRRSLPVQTASKAADWVSQQPNRTVVIGDDIFRVDPNADYNLHYPLRRGQFNLHKGVGGSVFNVLDNIHSIWEYAIRDKLGIPLRYGDHDIHFSTANNSFHISIAENFHNIRRSWSFQIFSIDPTSRL